MGTVGAKPDCNRGLCLCCEIFWKVEAYGLALVAPGLQILRLKKQPVLLYCRKALRCGNFAFNGKRLVGKPKGLKLSGRNIHVRKPFAADIEHRKAAGRRTSHEHCCGIGRRRDVFSSSRALRGGIKQAWHGYFGLAQHINKIVAGAAVDAARDARILRRLAAGPDHPVALHFPEGEYLKGLLVQVD